MGLASGTRLGAYEIVALIGAGGMGEVYRARDSKLGRDVALKILPEAVAADADRLARLRREAQVLASLNHPNIAAIYGFEDNALVLELVEGPTLADRLAGGKLPVAEAIAIARQLTEALGAAHDLGIIHRDLKPANIKIRDDGTVKVLDFGLAKAMDPVSVGATHASPLHDSPTMTGRATQLGMILGTAAYMAPEQARGKVVDRRADLWAFGVVLYEMLTGRRAFDGPEISDVLASVLKDTPPMDALPSDVPASVRRLLRRTLEKDRAKRLDSMTAARFDLADVHDEAAASPRRVRDFVVGSAAAGLITALVTGLVVSGAMRPAPPTVVKFGITPPPDQPIVIEQNHNDLAITRDGSTVVYLMRKGDVHGFSVRPLGQFEGRLLDTLGPDPRGQFVSPDGRWVGFQLGQGPRSELRKAPLDGGVSLPICLIDGNLRGASWADDNSIVFATATLPGLKRVSASGGAPEQLTTPVTADGERAHLWPQHLPGGAGVLFAIRRVDDTWDVAALSLATRTWRVLVKNGMSPRFVAPGTLVFASSGAIRAVAFDPVRLEVTGEAIEVQGGVLTKESGAADFAVSENGTLVFLPGQSPSVAETLAWRDASGKDTALRVPPLEYSEIRISPNGQLAIATVGRASALVLWLIDLTRETAIRLTPADMIAVSPAWSADSREIVFAGIPGSEPAGIFRLVVTGAGQPVRLTSALGSPRQMPASWSPDGKTVLFIQDTEGSNVDIHQLTLGSPPVTTPLIADPRSVEMQATLSPDGRSLAYLLLETQTGIFVRPYPNINDGRIPVSAGRGSRPAWGLDGRALYFLRSPEGIMVASVGPGTPPSFGPPRLFMRLPESNSPVGLVMPPVGGRVLRTVPPVTGPPVSSEYRVVLNWAEELKALLATKK